MSPAGWPATDPERPELAPLGEADGQSLYRLSQADRHQRAARHQERERAVGGIAGRSGFLHGGRELDLVNLRPLSAWRRRRSRNECASTRQIGGTLLPGRRLVVIFRGEMEGFQRVG